MKLVAIALGVSCVIVPLSKILTIHRIPPGPGKSNNDELTCNEVLKLAGCETGRTLAVDEYPTRVSCTLMEISNVAASVGRHLFKRQHGTTKKHGECTICCN